MKNQYLILVVGHNASGKTTLSKEIVCNFKFLNKVSGDDIRNFLKSNILFYNDSDFSHWNKKSSSIFKIVPSFRDSLIKELLLQGESVLLDGGGITRKGRSKFLKLKKGGDKIGTIIIEARLEENKLLKRLEKRIKNNPKEKWIDFYYEKRKPFYETVSKIEADHVLYFNQNKKEIINKLKKILKK